MRRGVAERRRDNWLDGLSICMSMACLIHCLGLPLLLAALPALAEGVGTAEWLHLAVLALALPVSALALGQGWQRHRAFVPLAVGAVGLMLMIAGVTLANRAAVETGLTVAGSLMLAAAHIGNWRNRRGSGPGAIPRSGTWT